ncbi:hypothetical protein B0H14DRAFT_2944672 [Mycena olivaceomarginata]|nr:hypothetical protein B0H14DRAFT_2944672 [Mycena olivaceomarginata]
MDSQIHCVSRQRVRPLERGAQCLSFNSFALSCAFLIVTPALGNETGRRFAWRPLAVPPSQRLKIVELASSYARTADNKWIDQRNQGCQLQANPRRDIRLYGLRRGGNFTWNKRYLADAKTRKRKKKPRVGTGNSRRSLMALDFNSQRILPL